MPTKSGGGGKQEQFDTKTGQYVESGKSIDKEDSSDVKNFKDKISQFKASNANSGYSGYSMSNRAVKAYESGEMPLSNWSKEDILDNVESYIKQNNIQDIDLDKIKKMSLQDLKKLFLRKSSWHHTGKMYNQTDFYALDDDYLDELTNSKIDSFLERKQEERKEQAEILKKGPERKYGKIYYSEWEGEGRNKKKNDLVSPIGLLEKRGAYTVLLDKEGNELLRKKTDGNYVRIDEFNEELQEQMITSKNLEKTYNDFYKNEQKLREEQGESYINPEKRVLNKKKEELLSKYNVKLEDYNKYRKLTSNFEDSLDIFKDSLSSFEWGHTKINPSPKALDFFKQQTNNLTKSINWGRKETHLPENYENKKAVTEWGTSIAYYPNYKINELTGKENLPIPNGTIGLSQIRDNKEKKWVLVKKDDSAALGFTYIDDNDDEDLVSKIKEVKKKMRL
ncbi:MAG: hypothetical protein PHQ01_04625 [Candidatus Pacebacteria bacterium]|nr:hypothetical protein [Candidatus Paceibacterota bacterium]